MPYRKIVSSAALLGFFLFSLLYLNNSAFATTLLSDTFTGTTINASNWTEVDAGGVGGTTGNIQQNGNLSMTGSGSWNQNYVVTNATYDRTAGALEMEADVTCGSGSSIMGIGYGDPGVFGGGQSYTMYVVSNTIHFSRQISGGNAEDEITTSSCTDGVPFHIRIAIDATTGASIYIDGNATPAATLIGGTFNNKGFFLSGHSGTATLVDNFVASQGSSATAPDAPTSLITTPASTQMGLSWTAPVSNGGAAITDYLVEYKLASEPTTWTTFSDGISTAVSTTITGLTNGLSYNFRISAVNSAGTSTPSATATATPALSVPSAPQSLSASSGVSGLSVLTWSAPVTNGGASITDYTVEYKLSSTSTYSTFADGTSASTGATVTGLTNGLSYNFRVKAVNSVGTSAASNIATATPNTYSLSDDFTGTTIDTGKWTEVDAGGLGGTVGNVQQNGSLTTTGNGAWGSNMVKTVNTYVRDDGDVTASVDVTLPDCAGTTMALSYGGHLTSNSTYFAYYHAGALNFAGFVPGETATISPAWACTSGVPFNMKMVILQAGGAQLYIDDVLKGTIASGTYTGTFALQGFIGTATFDNFHIILPVTGPDAPTSLVATPGDGQVGLTWVAGADNGAAITDYVVEYKLSSTSTWSTFADGTSASTGATVTGLTNGLSYNFRVSATNSNGTGAESSTASATPVSATPAAPVATNVAISGTVSVGELVTGTYTYSDPNGNSESGSTFRWLRSDTLGGTYSAISGATSISYTIALGDLAKYLKFEVTPRTSVSPTTGVAVLSSASAQVSQVDYLNQILSTGQSLSVGVAASPALSTTQPYNNKMLTGGAGGIGTGASFTPLIESGVETMSSSLANSITFNDPGNDLDTVVSLHGVSGYTYAELKKGTSPYATGMTQVTNAKSAATGLGRTSRVIAVTSIHGETDNFNGVSGPTYQGYLEEWQHDYDTDVKAITGQSNNVPLFIDQMSSFMSSYANDATSEIPIYQLYAAEDNPGQIVLVGPKYYYNYSDRHHLTAASSRWDGEYYAKVIKKVAIDHESWRPLSPDSAIRSGNIIYANFHVPAGVLAFDTNLVSPRTNYGFEYYDSTASASISSVEILDADTVKVTLSGTPTGSNQRLRYAYTGVPGTDTGAQNPGTAAGNLRDTDPYPSLYGNTLYDWAVHFDEPITLDSEAPTITSVSSDKANGTYAEGEVIDVDVTFSEPVTSTGNVTVTLETGTIDRSCTFSVSNSATGTCNYTVQGGDTSSDLTVKTISGTIADQSANPMTNFVPSTNLAANKALVIDTTGSVISLLTSTPGNTSSVITWTTDELSSSIVDYGLTSSYGTSTSETHTSPRVASHSVSLSGLVACSEYHYRVRSKDSALNQVTGTDNTFTTTGCTGSATVNDQNSTSVTTAGGGTAALSSGGTGIGLDIPAGATGADAIFQIKSLNQDEVFAISGMPNGVTNAGSYAFDLKALTGVGTAVTSFLHPIEITFTYQDSDVVGIDESSLFIYRYDGSTWTPLTGCVVDASANTITCTTSNFSVFSLFGTASVSSSSGRSSRSSSTHYGCKDPKAINFQQNATSKPSLCQYASVQTVQTLALAPTSPNTPTVAVPTYSFTRSLQIGSVGSDVKDLQKYLNANGYIVSVSGPGSIGNETTIFGAKTRVALIKFQKAKGIVPSVGYFGPITRGKI